MLQSGSWLMNVLGAGSLSGFEISTEPGRPTLLPLILGGAWALGLTFILPPEFGVGARPEKLVEVGLLVVLAVEWSREEDGRGKNEDVAEVATMTGGGDGAFKDTVTTKQKQNKKVSDMTYYYKSLHLSDN